eukprot:Blabericola_migrator_1__8141@NODE_41_length_17267_cov_152_291279_g37_i0_p4_GENE_NODE_41_length_17267_cov_152_291279_g37_i0NODE_41_length_17267_cov_152_291279_g37_i0_p4_ORF_typecomplete_len419_score45_95His_Phos_1/PF00300_22/8_4e20_NODE_41_length_17267_cov_152_291279_g37_i075768832
MFIRLHLLRHGQAKHNVVDWPKQPSAAFLREYFDPGLTDIGVEQCKASLFPQELKNDSAAVYWVSPLQRTIQTACHAVPEMGAGRTFHLLEFVRERGGEKACDLRLPLADICKSLELIGRCKWDTSQLPEEDSLGPPVRRESVQDLAPRIMVTLSEIAKLIKSNSQVKNLAIISHSGFLSLLMAALGVCPHLSRWLNNAEWRSLTINIEVAIKVAAQRMGLAANSALHQPALVAKTEQFRNAAIHVAVPQEVTHPKIFYVVSDTFASVAFSTKAQWNEVTVVTNPLGVIRHEKGSVVDKIIGNWTQEPTIDQRPPDVSLEQWAEYQTIATPPFTLNGNKYIYRGPEHDRIQFHEEGVYAFSHVVMLCEPQVPSDIVKPIGQLPIWVTMKYLEAAHRTAILLLDEVGAQFVTLVFSHDM